MEDLEFRDIDTDEIEMVVISNYHKGVIFSVGDGEAFAISISREDVKRLRKELKKWLKETEE